MRRTGAAVRARARRRTTLQVLLAASVLALAPVVWLSYDLMLRVVYTAAVLIVVLAAVRRRVRGETPAHRYARALGESSALHVHLSGVRIAAVHADLRSTLLTLTWRASTSVLLDADGRPRGEVARNALTTAYTMSIPVDDPVAAALLAGETALGRVSVYGTADVLTDPRATLLDGVLLVDQYDVAFPSWTGSLVVEGELADREP